MKITFIEKEKSNRVEQNFDTDYLFVCDLLKDKDFAKYTYLCIFSSKDFDTDEIYNTILIASFFDDILCLVEEYQDYKDTELTIIELENIKEAFSFLNSNY